MKQGLILTLLGMTWVCVFLIFMIILTILSSVLIRKFFPEKDESATDNGKNKNVREYAAALAIVHHLKRRRGSK